MPPPRARLDRLVAWSPAILLGGLAALTYWLDAQVQAPAQRDDGSARHDPDLYIERLSAVSFDTEGRVRQMLTAASARHYPDDDSIELAAPRFEMTNPGQARLAVTADTGTVSGDRETVTLRGTVRATRDAVAETARDRSPTGPATFTTDLLRVNPKLGRAETDRPVTIEEPRGIIHGVGMILDNKARTLKLKSAVRGTLQPNTPPK
jgi:lipopolysaccharide export system protein LptC